MEMYIIFSGKKDDTPTLCFILVAVMSTIFVLLCIIIPSAFKFYRGVNTFHAFFIRISGSSYTSDDGNVKPGKYPPLIRSILTMNHKDGPLSVR